MNEPWLNWAIEIQSIAQAGLQYGRDAYDKERYQKLRDIAAQMLSYKTNIPEETVKGLFCADSGYPTPKVDTRAAVFQEKEQESRILLVHENNGTWSLPGGWCDVDQSIASNTEKEVQEETGLTVQAKTLIAVQDWRRHNVTNYAYGVVKTFMLCEVIGGEFHRNIETTETAWFGKDALPENLATEKTSREQILLCFAAKNAPAWKTQFD